MSKIYSSLAKSRPIARIHFGGLQNPQNVDLLDPKSGLFEPHPLDPLTNNPFLPILWLKVGPFGRFDLLTPPPPPPPPAYGPGKVIQPRTIQKNVYLWVEHLPHVD